MMGRLNRDQQQLFYSPLLFAARPTRTNRTATLLRAVPRRRSEAVARMAPARTQTPSTAATISCGQARIALTRSPVMWVNASSPALSP
jgi:hypothetical protein